MSTFTDRSLYRSRSGWIFGVCQGLADYAQISVFWVRLLIVLGAVFSSFIPILIIYIMAAIFMKPAPLLSTADVGDWEIYNSYSENRGRAIASLKRRFDNIDRRTQRMETIITDREYNWEERLRTGA